MMTAEDIVRVEIDFHLHACDQLRGVAIDYLTCQHRLNEWQEHFNNACENVRSLLNPGDYRITLIENRVVAIAMDQDGEISINELVNRRSGN